jgi:rubrerythrin
MKDLNGTKTHDNLKAAFAGESQANRRYLYFANKADVEGQNDVAAVFRSTAEGETGHAHGHLDYLAQVAIRPPACRSAHALESQGRDRRRDARIHRHVPGHGQGRAREGFDEIADWFETLAKAERSHANRSRRLSTYCPTDVWQSRSERRRNATAMTLREGNLLAPTPPSLDWRNAEFYDEARSTGDGARLRHLPRLPAVREPVPVVPDALRPRRQRKTMEVDGVAKSDYGKVVDQCYLCDLCYMTKCPYVPPHPVERRFPPPHAAREGGWIPAGKSRWRDRLLTSTDRVGRSRPSPSSCAMVNKANTTPSVRK